MPFFNDSLRVTLHLDHMPVSLQRLEMAMIGHFGDYPTLAAAPDELAAITAYAMGVFKKYSACTPDSDSDHRLRCRDGILDLHTLLSQVFEDLTGMVLFQAVFSRMECVPAD